MLSASQIDSAGVDLLRQHEQREKFRSLPSTVTIQDAQHIQNAYVGKLLSKFSADVVGYKVALTTKQIREWLKIHEPACGQILSNRVHSSPFVVNQSDYVRLSVETEICIVLDGDMSGPCTVDEVQENLRSVHCAYELVEDRGADLAKLDVISLTADNCWNAGAVIGPPGDPGLDLTGRQGQLWVNNLLVATGNTDECLNGNPLYVVAWLAEYLGRTGHSIKAGQPVMTGSIMQSQFLQRGDRAVFLVEGLDSVELQVA